MNFSEEDLKKALNTLYENYPDQKINKNKSICGKKNEYLYITKQYSEQSMKRSFFKYVCFKNGGCKNVAFNGSSFEQVKFLKCPINGNSFACCIFYRTLFLSNDNFLYSGNNFSQTSFTSCRFINTAFKSSGFLQVLFHKCVFEKGKFQSSTLEGCTFVNCKIYETDFSMANIEFIELIHTELKSISFPFYQFAYIIGADEYLKEGNRDIFFKINERKISLDEYRAQVDNLILYYTDKAEYFPVCNLNYIKGNFKEATETLLEGINYSLHNLDFRMIRHYCRLAKRLDLLDEFTTHRIVSIIENYLTQIPISPERINECMIHYGEIFNILHSWGDDQVSFSLNIRTNVQKNDTEGIYYINTLCNRLNESLAKNNLGQTSFAVATSSSSPFQITIDIICAAGALATIADFIWHIVDVHHNKNNIPDDYKPIDKTIYNKYLNARIESCKDALIRVKNEYSKKEMNPYIENITQKLQTDLEELFVQDVMIFKKENHSEDK